MQGYTNHSIGSDDGKSISFKDEKVTFIGPTFSIKFWHIGIAIIFAISILLGSKYLNMSNTGDELQNVITTTNKSSTITPESTSYDSETPFSKNGFVFEDSSTRILTREEILTLQNVEGITFQRLLRMSINEIYARKGQVFQAGEINDSYYQQFEWYTNTSKHTVKWEEFSEQEKANLRLLILIEREYGYE